jgi:NAD(P)H-binding
VHKPLGLLAELTHRCPLGCPYCSNPLAFDVREDELDTATWGRIFREAAGLGVLQVHLSGASRGRGGFLYSVAFHLLLGRVYEDKDVQEWIVRRSKLDWVIERPVILTDGPKTNGYRALVDPRDWICGFISRADAADFLIKQIDDNAFLHKTPVLMSCREHHSPLGLLFL